MPAVGFSPLAGTPILLHEHNEALSVATFLKGIGTYVAVIEALAAAPRQPAEEERDELEAAIASGAAAARKRARRR